jgi:beta-mannanase
MAMKKIAHLYVIGFVLTGIMAQQSIAGRENQNSSIGSLPSYLIGAYQPMNQVKPLEGANSSHGFFSLTSKMTPGQLKEFLSESKTERTVPMISLEPFPPVNRLTKPNQLHSDILSGKYDQEIKSILIVLKQEQRPILIRFAHEMDVPGQYPWCFENGIFYIEIYRYLRETAKKLAATNLIWVWSPQGRVTADHYWPGDDQVDIIGISVYASKSFNARQELKSFQKILGEKIWLSKRFNKPLIAAEVGVSGTEAQQEQWMRNALKHINNQEVRGFFYFQSAQPSFMPLKTGPEDWRLKGEALRALVMTAKGVKQ